MQNCYVYQYSDPVSGTPFYIGKGKDKRAWYHLKRKDQHHVTYKVQKMLREGSSPTISFIAVDIDDELACLVEREAIAKYGRKDLGKGSLLNLTDGGDGIIGLVCSEEHRRKLSLSGKGRIVSKETKALMSQVRTGEKRSEETKTNISKAKLGQKYSNQAKLNMSAGHVGMKYSEERNARVSAGLKGHHVSDETKRKISAARKAYLIAKKQGDSSVSI